MALIALMLAGCVEAQTVEPDAMMPDPGPGYPPKMGDVTSRLGDQAVAWETFDFSVGAFDASAWVEDYEGPPRLYLTGYPPGDPLAENGLRLRVTGKFAGRVAAGALHDVTVALENETTGSKLLSKPQGAAMTVERIDRYPSAVYGDVSGTITAMVCPLVAAAYGPCIPFSARYSTRVQFSE